MECRLTRKICKLWRRSGAMICTTDSLGWPDRWVGWNGFGWWLEFKSVDGRVKPHQKRVLGDLRRQGAASWVIRISKDFVDIEYPDGFVAKTKVLWGDVLHTLCVL